MDTKFIHSKSNKTSNELNEHVRNNAKPEIINVQKYAFQEDREYERTHTVQPLAEVLLYKVLSETKLTFFKINKILTFFKI